MGALQDQYPPSGNVIQLVVERELAALGFIHSPTIDLLGDKKLHLLCLTFLI